MEAPPSETLPLAGWLGIYALSGFIALSLEIVWFRVLDVAVKSTAFTFGTVLAIYLLGSAAGCFVVERGRIDAGAGTAVWIGSMGGLVSWAKRSLKWSSRRRGSRSSMASSSSRWWGSRCPTGGGR